jgi:hypothetical protein
MAGLVDQLEDGAGEPPLGDSVPPDPQTPTPSEKVVDPDKLMKAWVVMVDVQKQLVRAIQRNERDNRGTRTHNTLTRIVVLGSLLAAVAVGYRYSEENNELLQEVRAQQAETKKRVDNVADDSASTLRAVRVVAEAVGAKLEADTAMHPAAEEAAREKAVEAQEEALTAELHVASDPSARATAAAKLVTVRERKKATAAQTAASIERGQTPEAPRRVVDAGAARAAAPVGGRATSVPR